MGVYEKNGINAGDEPLILPTHNAALTSPHSSHQFPFFPLPNHKALTMRFTFLFLFSLVFLPACKDIDGVPVGNVVPEVADVESVPEVIAEKPASKIVQAIKKVAVRTTLPKTVSRPGGSFPFSRVISDADGRSIKANVLAKHGGEIGVLNQKTFSTFILSVDQLGKTDRAFMSALKDGGDFPAVKEVVERNRRLMGRVANWHRRLPDAQKEAAELGVPLLTVFIFSDDAKSASIEQKVLYAQEFRNWANLNLALCLIRLDSDSNSITEVENRKIASGFGIEDKVLWVLSIADNPALSFDSKRIKYGGDAIDRVAEVISNPALGYPVPAI